MPHDDLEQYLAGLRPLPPDPLPTSVRRTRWIIPLALVAALPLAFWLIPQGTQPAAAQEAPFTLGRANQLLVAGTPWKTALDEAAFSGQTARRGALEFLTQEELVK